MARGCVRTKTLQSRYNIEQAKQAEIMCVILAPSNCFPLDTHYILLVDIYLQQVAKIVNHLSRVAVEVIQEMSPTTGDALFANPPYS